MSTITDGDIRGSGGAGGGITSRGNGDVITGGGSGGGVSGGPGYRPKGGGVGKGLRLLNDTLVDTVLRQAEHVMQVFRYNYTSTTGEASTSISAAHDNISFSDSNGSSSSSTGNSNGRDATYDGGMSGGEGMIRGEDMSDGGRSPDVKRFKDAHEGDTPASALNLTLNPTHLATSAATIIAAPTPPPITTTAITTIPTTIPPRSPPPTPAMTTVSPQGVEVPAACTVAPPPSGVLVVSPIHDNASLDSAR